MTIDEDGVENTVPVNRLSILRWIDRIDTLAYAFSAPSNTPPLAPPLQQKFGAANFVENATDK